MKSVLLTIGIGMLSSSPCVSRAAQTAAPSNPTSLDQALRSFKWSSDNFVRGQKPWGTISFNADAHEFVSMANRGGWNQIGARQIRLGNGLTLTFDERFEKFDATDTAGVRQFSGSRVPLRSAEPTAANDAGVGKINPAIPPLAIPARATPPATPVAHTPTTLPPFPAANVRKPPVGVPPDAQYFGGKWYRLYTNEGPWNDARQRCDRLGGQLAVIPDAATWEFVKSLTKSAFCWLGATDEQSEIWRWIDGTPFDFTAWGGNQPDNAGGREHYLHAFNGEWNDAPKDGKLGRRRVVGFVCEWKDR